MGTDLDVLDLDVFAEASFSAVLKNSGAGKLRRDRPRFLLFLRRVVVMGFRWNSAKHGATAESGPVGLNVSELRNAPGTSKRAKKLIIFVLDLFYPIELLQRVLLCLESYGK